MTVGVAPARPMQPDPPPASPPFETSSAPSRPPSDCRIPAFRCASGTAPASRPGRGATRRCLGSIAAAVGGTYSLAWRPPAFVGPRPADIPSVRVYDGLCRKAGVVVQPSSVLALRPGTRREDGLEVSNSLGAIVLLAFLPAGRPWRGTYLLGRMVHRTLQTTRGQQQQAPLVFGGSASPLSVCL